MTRKVFPAFSTLNAAFLGEAQSIFVGTCLCSGFMAETGATQARARHKNDSFAKPILKVGRDEIEDSKGKQFKRNIFFRI